METCLFLKKKVSVLHPWIIIIVIIIKQKIWVNKIYNEGSWNFGGVQINRKLKAKR